MNPITDLIGQSQFRSIPENFWEHILNDEQLRACSNLEKLLVGCEIIAAADELEVLLAA